MDTESKFDLLLGELKKIFAQIDARFDNIDKKFEQIDARFDKLEKRFDNLENRFDNLEKRFDKFEEKNEAEHKTMFNMLNSLNSAFLRFESEQTKKINYLFDSDEDRKNHQDIYAHEFTHLNDLVAKNSFRISNLEQHIKNN